MRSIIRWAVRNSPAMNMLVISTLLVGLVAAFSMRREVFPEFDLEIILVSVVYPGASPGEIEEGICQKIEEAVRPIAGIKAQTSVAQEGAANVILELESDVPDVQKILAEVQSEVDRIPSMPPLAEDPEVQQITLRTPAIRLGIMGPESDDSHSEWILRDLTEQVRDELLGLDSISQANIIGGKDFQIDIEIDEHTLRKYGLTLQQVAQIVRRENIELPSGSIKTPSQEMLIRGKNRRLTGEEIAKIPLVTSPDGVVLTVGDLGVVRDEFADTTVLSRLNGRPGLVISVDRTMSEDLLAMSAEVQKFVTQRQLPPGYEFVTWADAAVDVGDRLDLLTWNGIQGLILVFIVLAVFLELRLAFWVAMGIPVSILGGCAILIYLDQTMNMLSMFAFLMALGIIVDDAIVVGENVFAHRQRGASFLDAAINGTYEVIPSVLASIGTTVIAFTPLMFVSGVMGKFIAVMPVAIIAMLVISLGESLFVLPCHLAHEGNLVFTIIEFLLYPVRFLATVFKKINGVSTKALDYVLEHYYRPTMRWSLNNPLSVIAAGLSILLITAGAFGAGYVPYVFFPEFDNKAIEARVVYPDGTPGAVTDASTRRLEEAILAVDAKLAPPGKSLLVVRHRSVGNVSIPGMADPNERTSGAHLGNVYVELIDPEFRDEISSQEILALWREEAGEFPGVESLTFRSPDMGPAGAPIEFKLLADPSQMDDLEAAVEETKARLNKYAGVFDVVDDSSPGKWELQMTIKDKARAMGIPLAELAETVRAAYYGEEVMRLQRGRHEVKLMVTYPRKDRGSLEEFEDLRVRTTEGLEYPLTELAEVNVERGYSEINRVEQMRSITITADVMEKVGNADQINADLKTVFLPSLFEKYPGLRVRWEGQAEQSNDSIESMAVGLAIAMLCMFALLTLEFRSYFQPFLIMTVIPFGFVGAFAGHALLGLPVSFFSLFGLVALTGVVVNDSIVLIDFINHRSESGDVGLKEALIDSGCRRFRPILLTSLTTIAGLLPILTERSFQAQILIPMAAALCFGLLASTLTVPVLIPTAYFAYARTSEFFGHVVFNEPAPEATKPAVVLEDQTPERRLEAQPERPPLLAKEENGHAQPHEAAREPVEPDYSESN